MLFANDVSSVASTFESPSECVGTTQGLSFGHLNGGVAPISVEMNFSPDFPFAPGSKGQTSDLVDARGHVTITNPSFGWASFLAESGTSVSYQVTVTVTDATGRSAEVSDIWTINGTC